MYPHRIRLRGPWQCEPLARQATEPPPSRRVTMPCGLAECGLSGFGGRVRFVRKFGYPGRIDADERVWLTVDDVASPATIHLNGHDLDQARSGTFEHDVTDLLGPRNRLEIVLEIAAGQEGLFGEVALEVRSHAYLQGVTVHRAPTGKLVITGRVAGAWEQPLELYVLSERRSVHYETVSAGQAFTVEIEERVMTGPLLRVELVSVTTVWYFVELAI